MTTHKKILFSAYAFYPEYGGLEQQIFLLGQEFIRAGHEVTVLTEKPATESVSQENIRGINVIRISYVKKRHFLDYIKIIFQLSLFILTHRKTYDVVYLRAAITLYPLIFSFWKRIGFLKTRLIVTADTGGENDEVIQLLSWPFANLMLKFISSIRFFVSACDLNTYHYRLLKIPENKIIKIYNGIDTSVFSLSSYPNTVKNFLFIGRFIREKGLVELIESMDQIHKFYPNSKLFIAGDGPIQADIVKLIRQKKFDSTITYLGKISENERDSFFSLGECLISPSYSEAGPLVVYEAAARKKVVISTDVGDLKRMFGNQIIYCEKRSSKSLAQAMNLALKSNFTNRLDYSSIIKQVDIKRAARAYLSLSEVR